PHYSAEAESARVQGIVGIELVVDRQGMPTNITVLSPLGYGLDEMAIAAIEARRFTPGTKDGKPVDVLATIQVNFQLNRQEYDQSAERRRMEFNMALPGLKDPKRYDKSIKTLQDLAKQKYPPAMYAYGKFLAKGEAGP